jgi:hypothetical protein
MKTINILYSSALGRTGTFAEDEADEDLSDCRGDVADSHGES